MEENNYGLVPIAFVSDQYLFGADEIIDKLEGVLNDGYVRETPLLSVADYEHDISIFKSLSLGTIIIAGLVNGINPCSLSMLIFLLTLMNKKNNEIYKITECNLLFVNFDYVYIINKSEINGRR